MDNHRHLNAPVKVQSANFTLPRRGNSAVRIIEPKVKKPAQKPQSKTSSKIVPTAERTQLPGNHEDISTRNALFHNHELKQAYDGAEPNISYPHAKKQLESDRTSSQPDVVPNQSQLSGNGKQSRLQLSNPEDQPILRATGPPTDRRNVTSLETSNSSLDVYAKNYIPQYLTAINESPAQFRRSPGLPTINYSRYISNFSGSSILQTVQHVSTPPIESEQIPLTMSDEILSESSYCKGIGERMVRELMARVTELRELSMYNVSFRNIDLQGGLHACIIPGLREFTPQIDLGDIVRVRPWMCLMPNDLSQLAKRWYAEEGARMGKIAPGFFGIEYHAVVWRVDRIREEVCLRMDGFYHQPNQVCNLIFKVQDHQIEPIFRTIYTASEQLMGMDPSRSWIQKMLFPQAGDGEIQTTLSKGTFNLSWYDEDLNFEQKKAVDAVVQGRYGLLPFLISGPPGTGKTKSIIEMTMQLLRRANINGKRCHLLVCAPSDSAADVIAMRLKVHLDPKELFRLNGWTRSFAEVPEPLMIHSYIDEDLFSIPDFKTFMGFKVVVTTCRDADMLIQARLGNADLAKLTTQLALINPDALDRVAHLHWSALLLDEAAQATEPEALIPLMVVSPGREEAQSSQPRPQFIMAGDEHQLGPKLSLKSYGGLEKSLFQRLFERQIYADHPLSRKNGSRPLNSSLLPIPRPAFINLIRNYRSHPAILSVPSKLFYYDTLVPEVMHISPAVASWRQGFYRWPVLFVQNNSPDAVEEILAGNGTGAGALSNIGEVNTAERIVKSLLATRENSIPDLKPHEITVISAFRAQVTHLRQRFRKCGLGSVNIGPLEAFQGLENRIVIICTTRTRRDKREPGRFVREDQARGIGLIGDPKKFNVALTRAKEGLIVIGDQDSLTSTDPCWAAFVAFCQRNGCVRGSTGELVKSDISPGRMERALNYSSQENDELPTKSRSGHSTSRGVLRGNIPTSDEDMWNDGIVAQQQQEEVVLEDGADEEDAFEGKEDGEAEDEDGEEDEVHQQKYEEQPPTSEDLPDHRTTRPLLQSTTTTSTSTSTSSSFSNKNAIPNDINHTTRISSADSDFSHPPKSSIEARDFHFDRNPEAELRASGCEQQ